MGTTLLLNSTAVFYIKLYKKQLQIVIIKKQMISKNIDIITGKEDLHGERKGICTSSSSYRI